MAASLIRVLPGILIFLAAMEVISAVPVIAAVVIGINTVVIVVLALEPHNIGTAILAAFYFRGVTAGGIVTIIRLAHFCLPLILQLC